MRYCRRPIVRVIVLVPVDHAKMAAVDIKVMRVCEHIHAEVVSAGGGHVDAMGDNLYREKKNVIFGVLGT